MEIALIIISIAWTAYSVYLACATKQELKKHRRYLSELKIENGYIEPYSVLPRFKNPPPPPPKSTL